MLRLLGAACPHIVRFAGAHVADGALHILTEYAENGSLRQLLDRRRDRGEVLGEAEALDLFVQLVSGVRHLHAHKVVHRDIKPGNIFLDRRNLVRLGDFGIARVLGGAADDGAQPQRSVGTPLYLAPEVVEGKAADEKGDVWALGVVLYEMVALRPPFVADNLAALAIAISRAQHEPLASAVRLRLAGAGEAMEARRWRRGDGGDAPDAEAMEAAPQYSDALLALSDDLLRAAPAAGRRRPSSSPARSSRRTLRGSRAASDASLRARASSAPARRARRRRRRNAAAGAEVAPAADAAAAPPTVGAADLGRLGGEAGAAPRAD